MFWKKKPAPPQKELPAEGSVESGKLDVSVPTLEVAARKLAASLSAYSQAAYESTRSAPDADLEAAKAKVAAARKLVQEGRLGYALGRCLPDHVAHWHAWSQREGFANNVGFDAEDITAKQEKVQEANQMVVVTTTEFKFKDRQYRIVFRDKGMSYDASSRLGEIHLFVADQCVAKFDLSLDYSHEYSRWEYRDVRALKVGPWMEDVLTMAAQIEAHQRKASERFQDQRIRDAAREIDLGKA